jgi:hypothetical protein
VEVAILTWIDAILGLVLMGLLAALPAHNGGTEGSNPSFSDAERRESRVETRSVGPGLRISCGRMMTSWRQTGHQGIDYDVQRQPRTDQTRCRCSLAAEDAQVIPW